MWHNRWVLGLLTPGLAAALLLFGVIVWQTPALHNAVTHPLGSQIFRESFAASKQFLRLPIITALIWLLNTSLGISMYNHRDYRVAAYLLWTTTIAVELALWPLAMRLIGVL